MVRGRKAKERHRRSGTWQGSRRAGREEGWCKGCVVTFQVFAHSLAHGFHTQQRRSALSVSPKTLYPGGSCQVSVTKAWPQTHPDRRTPARQPAGLAMTAPHSCSVPAAESQVVELAACPAGPNTVGVPGARPEPPRTSGQGGGEDTVSAPGGSAFSQC